MCSFLFILLLNILIHISLFSIERSIEIMLFFIHTNIS